jgi:uncharacterized protein (TIGR00725 family)
MKTVIGVIGSGAASAQECDTAEKVGREIAKRDLTLVCGAMGGVMEAACRGAKGEGGLTIGIVPGDSKTDSNPYLDIPVVTAMGHARNIIVIRSSDAVIAIGGSYGTLSEIAFALRLEIPIIGIKTWDVSTEIKKAETPKEAVDMAIELIGANA